MQGSKSALERILSLPGFKQTTLLLAQRFIAGTTIIDLLEKKRFLNSVGFPIIINFLGESSPSFKGIKSAEAKYLELIAFLKCLNSVEEISLKASEFGLEVSHGPICYDWWNDCPEIIEVLEEADRTNLWLWLDAELLETREELWKFAGRMLEKISFLGVAYQAYGDGPFNSAVFLDSVIGPLAVCLKKGKTLGVRLCKGAYFSEKHILREQKEIREQYLKLAQTMLELAVMSHWEKDRGIFFPEFATHDPNLIYAIKRMARRIGLAKNKFRFAMLCGRQQSLASHLMAEGHTVAIYLPFGPDRIAYISRRLQENWSHLFLPFRREGNYHVCPSWPKSCSLNA